MLRFVVVLAVLALGLAAQSAAATGSLHLVEHQTFHRIIDHGKKGESPGDQRVFGGALLTPTGRKMGRDRVVCVVGPVEQCTATLTFPKGTLIAHGSPKGPLFTAKIIHGSGVYRIAHGTILVDISGRSTRYTVTLKS